MSDEPQEDNTQHATFLIDELPQIQAMSKRLQSPIWPAPKQFCYLWFNCCPFRVRWYTYSARRNVSEVALAKDSDAESCDSCDNGEIHGEVCEKQEAIAGLNWGLREVIEAEALDFGESWSK